MNRILIFNIFHSIESCTVVPFSRPRNINVIDILSQTCQRWISLSVLFSLCYRCYCWSAFVSFCRLNDILDWNPRWYFSIIPLCVSPLPRRFSCTSMRVWTYSRGRHSFLSPPVSDPANTRSTSWWWRRTPLTPLCIKSSSSLQSKVGSNLKYRFSILLKKETEIAYSNSKW